MRPRSAPTSTAAICSSVRHRGAEEFQRIETRPTCFLARGVWDPRHDSVDLQKKQSYEPIFTEITSLGTGAGTVDSVKPGGLVAIGTKLDPTLTRGDSLLGSIVGKPDSLPDNSNNAKVEVSLFDSAVGSANEEKITPIKTGENLRVNIGTAPILGKVTNVKSDNIELSFRRPVCLFEKSNIALSRRISDRWRLIGAGIVG